MTPARLLFVCHRADRTGAPLCLVDLIATLDRRRFEPHVLLGEEGPLVDAIKAHGVSPRILSRKDQRGPLQSFALRRAIRDVQPDLVQLSSAVGWTKSAALAAFSLGIPRVWHLHDDFRVEKYRRRLPWVRRLANVIVACSHNIAREIPSPKTCVIPNGVSHEFAKRGLPRDEFENQHDLSSSFRILFLGAMMPHKNVHQIVEASSPVLRDYPETEFLLVGGGDDPSYRDGILSRRDELGVASRVHVWPERHEVASIFNASDVVLLPSQRECFPRVILEAAACKTPVLASSVGDVPTLIDDGVNGWLIPSPCDSEALARALLEIRLHGSRWGGANWGSGHHSIAARYRLQAYADRFSDVWGRLLKSGGRQRSLGGV